MQRTVKPKTARTKLAENEKTALFVKGSTSSASVNTALSELSMLKRPNSIYFSRHKSNLGVLPFEDASSIEFLSHKNDASIVVCGSHSKKRSHALTFVRMFDHLVLDMLELGIERIVSMHDFKTPKAQTGNRPLFHFAGELFDGHPDFVQLKSMLLDTYHGEVTQSIALAGLGHVISLSHGPIPSTSTAPVTSVIEDNTSASLPTASLPLIHFRVYTVQLLKSGRREPRVNLIEHGPSMDLRIRRSKPADEDLWKRACRTKPSGPQTAEGAAKKRKRDKNVDVSEMGDKVGRIHVGRQDLDRLQSRKMKGLRARDEDAVVDATGQVVTAADGSLEDGIGELDAPVGKRARVA